MRLLFVPVSAPRPTSLENAREYVILADPLAALRIGEPREAVGSGLRRELGAPEIPDIGPVVLAERPRVHGSEELHRAPSPVLVKALLLPDHVHQPITTRFPEGGIDRRIDRWLDRGIDRTCFVIDDAHFTLRWQPRVPGQ